MRPREESGRAGEAKTSRMIRAAIMRSTTLARRILPRGAAAAPLAGAARLGCVAGARLMSGGASGEVDRAEEAVRVLIEELGEDVNREGILKTPKRYAKAMRFFTQGYKQDVDTILNKAIFSEDSDEMVMVRNIEIFSLCEHHLVPFYGRCHIAYLPRGKVVGLSKLARIAELFGRRLQVT